MIHDFDRRWWIGGSDIDKYVLARNQQTKGWQNWWAVKCGLAEPEHYVTSAMKTGTMLEHSILKTWDEDVHWDGQILYPELRLRINYDGWSDGIIYEVKCHRAGNSWSWDTYRGQCITQAWVYSKKAEELELPPFKEIHILEYAFDPEEECTVYEPEIAEAGEIPLKRERINDILIPYRDKQFKGIRSRLRPLAKQLRRIAPDEGKENENEGDQSETYIHRGDSGDGEREPGDSC